MSQVRHFRLPGASVSDLADGPGSLDPRRFTLDEVQDRMALQHLVAAYGHGIDRRDYRLLKSLYHHDAIDDHSPYYCGPASGFIDWLPEMLATWSATSHTMLNMLFLLDGDRAEGVITARAWHLTADGTREFVAWGRYADRYERRGGIWRFAHRFFILDSTEEKAAERQDSFATQGVETGRAGADDPIYHRLPLFTASRRD
jgi:hypothetical protein